MVKKGKGKGKKPNAPKPKNTKQKQRQQQNVNVKIHIDQSKKIRPSKGSSNTRVIHSYSPQPITSYPLFREEAQQPPPFRNLNEPTHTKEEQTKFNTREKDDESVRGLGSILGKFQTPMDRWKTDRTVNTPAKKTPSVASGKGSIFGLDDIYKSKDMLDEVSPFQRIEKPKPRAKAPTRPMEELTEKEQAQRLKNRQRATETRANNKASGKVAPEN